MSSIQVIAAGGGTVPEEVIVELYHLVVTVVTRLANRSGFTNSLAEWKMAYYAKRTRTNTVN